MSNIIFTNVASAPATPASGRSTVYFKTDKKPYYKSDAGTEIGIVNTGSTNTFTKANRGAAVVLVDGGTITPNMDDGNNFHVTLGGNRNLANPTNLTAGQSGVIIVVQDGSGNRTLSYGSQWKWPSGSAPTLTTSINAKDMISYYVYDTSTILCTITKDIR